MEFNLLGSLEVIVDGRPADLGGRKQQMVLAALMLDRNRVVSTERLIDVLWGERPAKAAAQTLRSYIYHLRRALGPARAGGQRPGVLVTRSPGYFLRVEPGELDSDRFESMAREGHAALANGDLAAARSLLQAGLDLWRGSALVDFADEEFARAAIARLCEQRLAAIEALFESRLALGEHREVIGELEEFTHQHPDREAARAQLMVALHRSGRQAEALQRYKDAWRYFQEEHGIEPELLKNLEAAILRDDPELSWSPPADELAPTGGPPSAATRERGDQQPDPGGKEHRPMMALHQLPPDTDVLAGRDAQLDELREVLGAHDGASATTVVLITGQAGVGKTALAVRAAHLVSDAFPDGQLYVQLEGTRARPLDPYTVLGHLLWALGIPGAQIPGTMEEREWLYRDRLASRRTLVLLDNAASEAQVRPLLPGSAGCAVLVTSRSSLGGLDATRFLDLHVLASDDALQLLGRLIGPARVQSEPAAARRIVQLCGGLPLALCIVGAKLRSRGGQRLQSLAERLSREQGRLGELAAGDRAVRASFAPSYESLQAGDKRAFQLLGLLRSPNFAAWVIAPLLEEACTVAEQRAERLADAHLLEFAREDETGRVRYRFHDLLRLFAQELMGRQEPEAAQQAAVVRLLGAYLGLTRQADAQLDFGGLGGVDDRATWPLDDPELCEAVNRNPLGWFAAEHTSLVRAVEQAFEAGLHELTPTLANTIAAFFEVRGHLDDWLHTHELALRAARADGNRRWEAYTMCGLGVAYREKGELEAAVRCFEQCMLEAAVRCFEQCMPIAWELGDGRLVFFAMLSLGVLHRLQSRWEQAMTTLDQCLSMVEGRDEPYWHAYTLREIGILHRYRGNWEEAIDRFQQASKLLEHVHSRRWLAATFREIGIVHREQGQFEAALELFRRSMDLFQQVGDHRREAATLRSIAIVRLEQRRLEDARDHLERSLRIFQERHDRHGAACTLVPLGEVHGASGDHRQAVDLITEGLATFKERGDRRWEGKALLSLGWVLAAAGRRTTAEAHWRAAARLLGDLEAPEAQRAQALLDDGSIGFNHFPTSG